jgi:1-deoxy-D-xylulose-5-phosphate synthase
MELSIPVVRVGWPDSFIEHGKVEELREKYGLTAEAALEKASEQIRLLVDAHARRVVSAAQA